MRESLEEAPCDRSSGPDCPPISQVLWEGILTCEVIELGPSGSFSINHKLALTCWPADVRRLLEGLAGRRVRIVIEASEALTAGE